jgi:hypothetical protein
MNGANILEILNGENAGDIRAKINTNFANINALFSEINLDNIERLIITSVWTETFTETLIDGTYQLAIASDSIKAGVWSADNGVWSVLGELTLPDVSEASSLTLSANGDGIGYTVPTSSQNSNLENQLVGYVEGVLGTADCSTPTNTIGYYKDGKIYSNIRVTNSLSASSTAGQLVYLGTSGGLSLTAPTTENYILQVVGVVSADNSFIDLNINYMFATVAAQSTSE